jgi:hypothetical protein
MASELSQFGRWSEFQRSIDSGFSHLGALGRFALAIISILAAQSILWGPDVPLVLKLGLIAVAGLTLVRPAESFLIVAGIAPLGRILSIYFWPEMFPARIGEAFVLAFLAAWQFRNFHVTKQSPLIFSDLRTPVWLFGITVGVSAAVHLSILQIWKDYPWPFIKQFFGMLTTQYLTLSIPDLRPWIDDGLSGYGFIIAAALILEGIALFLAIITLSREQPQFPRRLAIVIVGGAVVASGLSLINFSTAAVSAGNIRETLPELLNQRWSVILNKVNSSGSYFILLLPIAIGLAVTESARRVVWIGSCILIGVGLWLSGARAVMLTGLALLIITGLWLAPIRTRFRIAPWAQAIALLLCLGIAAIFVYRLQTSAGYAMTSSVRFRLLFAETSAQMVSSKPWFGLGIGQYLLASTRFSSPELLNLLHRDEIAPRENPHNNFLLIISELGVIGLGMFLWLLVKSQRLAWLLIRHRRGPPLLTGAFIGVLACLLTCIAGHPLIYEAIAFTFWMTLGLVVSLQRQETESDGIAIPDGNEQSKSSLLTTLAITLLIVSLPVRAQHEQEQIDFSRITYGFHDWETQLSNIHKVEGDYRLRWTSERATLHFRSAVQTIRIPVRALIVRPDWSFRITTKIDGSIVDRLILDNNDWKFIVVQVPNASRSKYTRLDLEVEPVWIPKSEISESEDERKLGVQVGEVEVFEARGHGWMLG